MTEVVSLFVCSGVLMLFCFYGRRGDATEPLSPRPTESVEERSQRAARDRGERHSVCESSSSSHGDTEASGEDSPPPSYSSVVG